MGQMNYKEEVDREFSSRRKKSYEAYQRAKQVIPAGVMARGRLFSPYPFYIQKGESDRLDEQSLIVMIRPQIGACPSDYGCDTEGSGEPVCDSTKEEYLWLA
jgi:hypothetical protein